MKFCQSHWDQLGAAIEARGLSHLVAKSGADAAKRMVEELRGQATDDTYDPLMAAHWMLSGRALECGGSYLLGGEYCPLCEAEKGGGPGTAAQWVEGCTDAVRKHCIEKGLILGDMKPDAPIG